MSVGYLVIYAPIRDGCESDVIGIWVNQSWLTELILSGKGEHHAVMPGIS